MDKIEKIRAEIERQMKFYDEEEMKAWNDSEQGDEDALWYQGHRKMCAKLLTFLDTLSEEPDKSLEEAADTYASDSTGFIDMTAYRAFIAGAKWQKEQMMKIITKDDNLEEAGVQYVETYFRDIDWTPNVIKSCLEEAFISGGEYVFKQIKDE